MPGSDGRGRAGGVVLGLGAGLLGHVLCVAIYLATLFVSSRVIDAGDSDDSGDREQAWATITVIVIGLTVLALTEAALLTGAVAVVVERRRRSFGIGMLAGWLAGVLFLVLYVVLVWFGP